MYYNFVRIHKTLRTTPAMTADVTERLYEIGDIVDVLEAWETARGDHELLQGEICDYFHIFDVACVRHANFGC